MARNIYRSPLLYVVAAVGIMALLLVAVRTVGPSAPSSGDGEAVLVSPDGRIRIHLVQGYADSKRVRLTIPDIEVDAPSAVYVPSYLPEGLEHANTRLLTSTSLEQLFLGEGKTLTILQHISATQTGKVGFVEEISVDGRQGFLVQGGWTGHDRSATWDEGQGMTLLLEVENGVVIVQGEGDWLTRQGMVRIASSLDPDRDVVAALTKHRRGRFSQFLIDKLGPTFGPLYEPGHILKGYVPQGGPYMVPTRIDAESGGQVVLNNRVVQQYKTRYCYLNVLQHGRGSSRGPAIARRAIENPSETVVKTTSEGTFIYPGYMLMFSDSVLPNWPAKMSGHGDINVDTEGTGKTSGTQ